MTKWKAIAIVLWIVLINVLLAFNIIEHANTIDPWISTGIVVFFYFIIEVGIGGLLTSVRLLFLRNEEDYPKKEEETKQTWLSPVKIMAISIVILFFFGGPFLGTLFDPKGLKYLIESGLGVSFVLLSISLIGRSFQPDYSTTNGEKKADRTTEQVNEIGMRIVMGMILAVGYFSTIFISSMLNQTAEREIKEMTFVAAFVLIKLVGELFIYIGSIKNIKNPK